MKKLTKKHSLMLVFAGFAASAVSASAALPLAYETALATGATTLIDYAEAAGAIGIGIYIALKAPRLIKKAANALFGG